MRWRDGETTMQWVRLARSRSIVLVTVLAVAVLLAAAVWLSARPQTAATFVVAAVQPAGPPWRYGRSEARFTVIEYADLECPYCRAHFAVLRRWIDAHPEVNLQWHHLPLTMHEPAASKGARLAECVGEANGHAAFWQAVAWVYTHTRGDGQGLPEGMRFPDLTPAVQRCLDSERPDAVIRAQSLAAAQDGIQATPTLRLQDRESGKTLLLHGPVEGDALLSAIDLLAAGVGAEPTSKEMPADSVGDMPR
jgi:protein-disulfide isomerase